MKAGSGALPVISTTMTPRSRKCCPEVGTLFLVMAAWGMSWALSPIRSLSFCYCSVARLLGDVIDKQGQGRFGWQAVISQALQVCGPRQGGPAPAKNTDMQTPAGPVTQRSGQGGHGPVFRQPQGLAPPSMPPPSPFFFPPSFFSFLLSHRVLHASEG